MNAPVTEDSAPMQSIALAVLREKYARADEHSVRDVRERVARALSDSEPVDKRDYYRERFLWALENGFIPGGRINANAGTALQSTLLNCFVQPLGDSIAERTKGAPGIYTALAEAAETTRRGGGVGYNFSALRPRGAAIATTGRRASGPLSYMDIFERSCVTLETTDARRGAQMAVLNIEHPDIFDFVDAKREAGRFTSFNLSVGVSDAFMRALENDGAFELAHKAAPGPELIAKGAFQREDGVWVYRTVSARDLWAHIMRAAYDSAEPGVLFLDRINREDNLAYCEHIDTTNPCGEQPLPAYGSCCLGSLNLSAFVEQPFTPQARFHFVRMMAVIKLAVRMLDNVIDLTPWPLAAQREVALASRRIGLGVTGLADALIMLGLRYDSPAARTIAAVIGETLRNTAYTTSNELAKERGAFPHFDVERYAQSTFVKRLPQSLLH
ncbi:MAG TPA: adenosylcobalamin-dependent ribonucleoside-diphosphate reductase, partial [Spongiibacteraceae bacterium]|nr:adenosylcobalamin-dependent ribonucleoside-diphosphate reductase [Spongiibacteraceae bacterium]